MGSAGKVVIKENGKIGVKSNGKISLFDGSGECGECCNTVHACLLEFPGLPTSYDDDFSGDLSGWDTVAAATVSDGKAVLDNTVGYNLGKQFVRDCDELLNIDCTAHLYASIGGDPSHANHKAWIEISVFYWFLPDGETVMQRSRLLGLNYRLTHAGSILQPDPIITRTIDDTVTTENLVLQIDPLDMDHVIRFAIIQSALQSSTFDYEVFVDEVSRLTGQGTMTVASQSVCRFEVGISATETSLGDSRVGDFSMALTCT